MNLYIFLQFSIGQKVWLLNPKYITQKVAIGTISGVGREPKLYFRKILEKWFKVFQSGCTRGSIPRNNLYVSK